MTVDTLQPPYKAIGHLLKLGQVVPFLGAGASLSGRGRDTPWHPDRPTCLPSGAELGEYLARQVSFPDDRVDDLAKVAQYFRAVMGRPELRRWLRDIFAHDFSFTAVHEFLADVPAPLLIVTTNYDDMIERAFRAKGRPYDLVIHPSDNQEWANAVLHWRHGATAPEFISPKRLYVDLSSTTVIYKMHGGVDHDDARRDSFVIDEDDYTEFLVRIAAKTAIPAIFAEIIRTRRFLFLGYSLRDWNFRVILSKIDKDLPRSREARLPSWAIQRRASALERKLWERRDVTIFDMGIAEFVEQLRPTLVAER